MAAKNKDLIETLLDLHEGRRSGVLRFEQGKVKKQLVLRQGTLAFSESNVPEEHLARILVEMEHLTKADLTSVTALMKAGKALDDALLAVEQLDAKRLEEGIREQAVAILASLLAWEDCESRFYSGEGLIKRQVNLAIPLPQIILLSARRAVSKRQLPPALGKLEGKVSYSESGRERRSKLPLDTFEAFAYSVAYEPILVENLISLMPSGADSPPELVFRLLLLGLLQLEAPGTESEESLRAKTVSRLKLAIEDMLRRFELANYYEILGVGPMAGEDEIKTAYHELAREYHPDRFQSGEYSGEFRSQVERLFTYITGAYTILSDTTSRAIYEDTRLKKDSKVESTLQARSGVDTEKEKMADALFRAGRASLSEMDYEKAATHFKECVWLLPEIARYHYYLGLSQSEVPRFQKLAEEHLLKAIELERTTPESYLALGKLYVKVNLPRRAVVQFQEVLRWDPQHREAQKLLDEISKGAGKRGR
jgi:tetratricopeptide (TPR) repeat protein